MKTGTIIDVIFWGFIKRKMLLKIFFKNAGKTIVKEFLFEKIKD